MKLGIYDVYEGLETPQLEIYKKILLYNNIEYKMINISDGDFWENILTFDKIMYKWQNNDNQHFLSNILRPVFESKKIDFYPNTNTTWHYDDKIKQYFLLKLHHAPLVESFIFFNRRKAQEFINHTSFPLVAKLNKGAGSSNVMLITKRKKAEKFIKKAFSRKGFYPTYFGSIFQLFKTKDYSIRKSITHYLKKIKRRISGNDELFWQRHKNYVFFQEYLSGNYFDTRVTTVGKRVHAFRRFVRKNDFRASGGEEWDINPEHIDKRMLKIALDISKKMKFQIMAYDFIYDKEKNPKIVEISYLFGQPGYPDFMNGYWDEELNWHEGRFWPQYFELVDLLKSPDLKCPVIDIPDKWLKNKIRNNFNGKLYT